MNPQPSTIPRLTRQNIDDACTLASSHGLQVLARYPAMDRAGSLDLIADDCGVLAAICVIFCAGPHPGSDSRLTPDAMTQTAAQLRGLAGIAAADIGRDGARTRADLLVIYLTDEGQPSVSRYTRGIG